ncbi:DnaJ-domain-containing protein [Serendipita vermifera]|nr:DnaJ-domain-containing protein [Serendipita vermifera]
MPRSDGETNWYRILGLEMDATQQQIKRAYHQALLRHHPDKNINLSIDQKPLVDSSPTSPLEVHTLRQAFEILSNPASRELYDEQLRSSSSSSSTDSKGGPRPAHVVSLDEFEQQDGAEGSSEPTQWVYPCRCGGSFIVTEHLLESDVHLISCDACSEALWVGYEVQEEP